MFAIAIPILLIFALLFEIVTWRYFVRNWSNKPLKISYLIVSILVYLTPVFLMLFLSGDRLPIAMWAILLLITNIAIKKVVTIVSFLGWVSSRKTKLKPRWTGTVASILIAIVVCFIGYGATVGKNDIRVENIEILSDKIPQSFDGYKIVQFSDLHLGTLTLDNNIVSRMVHTINDLHPDLIVQSGDLVNMTTDEFTASNLAELSKLGSVDGVVSVLGNHDLGFYIKDTIALSPWSVVREMRRIQTDVLGWQLLENENFSIYRGGSFIDIAGVTYPSNLNHNNFNSTTGGSDIRVAFDGLSDSVFRVFVTHNPKLFDSLPQKGMADLVLSGHVHSMQLAINFFGKKLSPAAFLYNPYTGLSKKDGMNLYINDGIGYVMYPLRLGTKPEITVFTLRSTHQKDDQ